MHRRSHPTRPHPIPLPTPASPSRPVTPLDSELTKSSPITPLFSALTKLHAKFALRPRPSNRPTPLPPTISRIMRLYLQICGTGLVTPFDSAPTSLRPVTPLFSALTKLPFLTHLFSYSCKIFIQNSHPRLAARLDRRPQQPSNPITCLVSALTRNSAATPLDSTLTKSLPVTPLDSELTKLSFITHLVSYSCKMTH
jgi:hypothetical protein